MSIAPTSLPLETAESCAQQAMALLHSHRLPPMPVNYAVAFEYHAGAGGELHKLLDAQLQNGKALDEYLLRDIYERHVASDRVRQFNTMRNDMQGILQTLMQTIGTADSHAEAYRERLEHNIGLLDDENGSHTLKEIASDLLEAAIIAKRDNQSLQANLEATRQEAEQLRDELEQHRRDALIDPLTGLFNRRALEQHLESLWPESEERPLAVLLLDIDHFKRINDTYGHAVGDVVIRHVADTMRKCIRGEDVAVRYGGEEFMVLLPSTPLDGAVKVAEAIRTRIEALRLTRKHDNLTLDPFTISLGVAMRAPEDDHESLFERADQALYQSKTGGRNRVTVSGVS
ncbi:MAG TPA: GGDEF domain-containing protein [Thiobacillaceae bacterium]|nr:GGDEF domain-containing protein [Thiobacillaceae bacterium]